MGHQKHGAIWVGPGQAGEYVLHRSGSDPAGASDTEAKGLLHLRLQAESVDLLQQVVADVGAGLRNAHGVWFSGDYVQVLHSPPSRKVSFRRICCQRSRRHYQR